MKFEQGAGAVSPFDRNFWTIHLVLPLMVAILALSSLERSGADLWLADKWYAFEGYHWSLRNHWLVNQVIHRDGREFVAGLGLVLAIVLVLSHRLPRMQRWRRPIAYLYTRYPAIYLLPGFLVGFTFAFGQEARGAHFISHDLWTLSLCWFGALGLFVLFQPDCWARTVSSKSNDGDPVP